jgi:hypothetical protein
MAKASSADDVKLMTSFDNVRTLLLSGPFADRLEMPLAYWVLRGDRRLPIAFLGVKLGELLKTPFAQLAGTAGIGKKKMHTLVELLARATTADPMAGVSPIAAQAAAASASPPDESVFDPNFVSELHWAKWRETIRRHGVGNERLGRLAPSLQAVPTVIWNSPLSFYLDMELEEMRRLKTHGEKRINVVLEVFHSVHQFLSNVGPDTGLSVRLTPRSIAALEDWIAEARTRKSPPTRAELEQQLVIPILDQLQNDIGSTVAKLARGRLGVGEPEQSVRDQARALGVTRARVYQLLEDCNAAMTVRWPDGRRLLDELAQKMDENYSSADAANLLGSLRELLYPLKFDSVDKHLIAQPTSAGH